MTDELRKQIESSMLFDAGWYTQQYHIPKETALDDYLNRGWKAGTDPSKRFSTIHYIERYADCLLYTSPSPRD